MDHALAIVTDEGRSPAVVHEAAALAAATGARLTVLAVTPEEAYQHHREVMDESGASEPYTIDQAQEAAEYTAMEVAADAVDGLDVDYEVAGIVGDPADSVLRAAESLGCDHVFFPNVRHTPAGKALFGDVGQELLLRFDGFVTMKSVDYGSEADGPDGTDERDPSDASEDDPDA
jgi:nucleotide-binding universal stress UspA family protein